MKLTGGCSCGNFRYEINGEPLGAAACHCQACQRRTGSAFGIGCFFNADDMAITSGGDDYVSYDRVADSGRKLTHRFCPICGTTVMWTAEGRPGGIAIAGGTFDDPNWIEPAGYFWTSKAHKWFDFPESMPKFEENRPPSK